MIPQCKRQIRTRDLLYVVYWITKWALFRLLVALSKNFPEGCEEPMPRLIIRFDLSYMQDLGGAVAIFTTDSASRQDNHYRCGGAALLSKRSLHHRAVKISYVLSTLRARGLPYLLWTVPSKWADVAL